MLTDGAPAAGYHVRRGLALRNADTRQPILGSYTDQWRPARERHADGSETDRRLNPFVLRQHLLGRYDVAWQAPSWTSLVVLDIDRPEVDRSRGVDPERELAANTARDQVLAALWDAFGFDRNQQPVILRSPGDGYHVYLPLHRGRDATERTWPAAWAREHIEHHLNQHGLELHPGRLELFPSGIRLRAPCGAGSALLVPTRPDFSDDLGLELRCASWRSWRDRASGADEPRLTRDIGPMVTQFCDAIEAARRPLEEWLGLPNRCWHSVWGPWGRRDAPAEDAPAQPVRDLALSPHKEEVPKAAGPLPRPAALSDPVLSSSSSQGWLLYGAAFRGRVRELAEKGLVSPGQRHDAALKLTWYWGKCRGLDKSATLERVREWLTAFEHVSGTRDRSRHGFVRDTMREVSHYYDRHVVPSGRGVRARGADVVLRPLSAADHRMVARAVAPEVRPAVETILRFLRGASDRDGRVPHAVNLSSRILRSLVGDRRLRRVGPDGVVQRRRHAVVAVEEMTRLGILALHTNYSTGRHGRLHTCWYRFGTGTLPCEVEGRLVLATRLVEEGRLSVVAEGSGEIGVRLDPAPDRMGSSTEALGELWWVRMYQRRAFTPAEFFEGDHRTVIPGPFRHRRRKGDLSVAPARNPETPPSGGGSDGGMDGGEEVESESESGHEPAPAGSNGGRRSGSEVAAEPPPHLPAWAASELFDRITEPSPLERQISRTWRRWLGRQKE